MKVLVIDVGGTHVKLLASGAAKPRRFSSGKDLTAEKGVNQARDLAEGWDYEAVSLGFPGLVDSNGARAEPENLGPGWVDFDFAAAFGRPVKVINDAAMQALGSYEGGRMLFLGLGTGVGSTLVAQKVVVPLELGGLPFRDDTLAGYLGREGFEKRGKEEWGRALTEAVGLLKRAFVADYVVLGGGNVKELESLPEGARKGGNENAFKGGFRLWETEIVHLDKEDAPAEVWQVVY